MHLLTFMAHVQKLIFTFYHLRQCPANSNETKCIEN